MSTTTKDAYKPSREQRNHELLSKQLKQAFPFPASGKDAVSNVYTAVREEIQAPHAVTILSGIGYEDGAYNRKWDWEVGIRREFGPLTMQATYVATNGRNDVGSEGKPTILATANLHF
jgi:hypothetical protein